MSGRKTGIKKTYKSSMKFPFQKEPIEYSVLGSEGEEVQEKPREVFEEEIENFYVFKPKGYKAFCQIGSKIIDLVAVAEVIAWEEATGEKLSEDRNIMVDVGLLPELKELYPTVKEEILKSGNEHLDYESLHSYYGNISINIDSIKGGGEDWTGIDYEEKKEKTRFGNIKTIYLFKTYEDAEKFLQQVVVPRLRGLIGLIGFTLDQPLNMIGTTGWDFLEQMVKGKDMFESSLQRIKNRGREEEEGESEGEEEK
jgi:hypothetical protein